MQAIILAAGTGENGRQEYDVAKLYQENKTTQGETSKVLARTYTNEKGEYKFEGLTALEHMEGLPQGIIHHSFYFANGNKFYRYPIKEDKFQKYVQIELT